MLVDEVAIRVLGPVSVVWRGGEVPLGPRQRRVLLGVLAVECGRRVGVAGLARVLWGEHPPRTARASVQAHVSRLRKVLREHGVPLEITTADDAYTARVDPSLVDAHRFALLVDQARAARDDDAAVEHYRAALALWWGGGADSPVLPGAGVRELRVVAQEECVRAELRRGRHREVLPELLELAESNPGRSRLIAQLMLALHRSGRQEEALRVYDRARERQATEFGLDPDPLLESLQTAVLDRAPLLLDPAFTPDALPVPH
ncbi:MULTISPECIES: AfsR/SARP family transcriptional regulator [Actinosynnema]|uniref:AfsR/SARP family transcriptional regulator n=1 Tax=Actinosynnema TaxID=40566 RepID=UPI0020A4E167|nr:AfsR/SARP family transcriptional regulator [Actinosynnema pretiosum]MCP2094437.1 DNA-binding transcriptional activator of the SARP family [Actinosynnema pretiosum]